MRMLNNWKPETKAVLDRFLAAGWKIEWTMDGDQEKTKFTTLEAAIEHVTSCDEGWVRVTKDGNGSTLCLVFGNSPGELVSDYTYPGEKGTYEPRKGTEAWKEELDLITTAHSQEWEGKDQPLISEAEAYPEFAKMTDEQLGKVAQ